MRKYEVRFWTDSRGACPLDEWIAELGANHKKRVFALIRMLGELGRELRLPNSRSLGDGLFELRDTSRGPGYRIYSCFEGDKLIILLASGDKSTQERDIVTATRRMEELR
jgi:putative addiction module killer protein